MLLKSQVYLLTRMIKWVLKEERGNSEENSFILCMVTMPASEEKSTPLFGRPRPKINLFLLGLLNKLHQKIKFRFGWVFHFITLVIKEIVKGEKLTSISAYSLSFLSSSLSKLKAARCPPSLLLIVATAIHCRHRCSLSSPLFAHYSCSFCYECVFNVL